MSFQDSPYIKSFWDLLLNFDKALGPHWYQLPGRRACSLIEDLPRHNATAAVASIDTSILHEAPFLGMPIASTIAAIADHTGALSLQSQATRRSSEAVRGLVLAMLQLLVPAEGFLSLHCCLRSFVSNFNQSVAVLITSGCHGSQALPK